MMEKCRAEGNADYLRALRAINGALQMGLGLTGATISDGTDIEHVLNAASLLGDRGQLEFAPFVAAWHPIIEELESRRITAWEARSMVGNATFGLRLPSLQSERLDGEIRNLIERILGDALGDLVNRLSRRPDGALFRELTAYLTGRSVDLTWLRSADGLGYLDPLLSLGDKGAVKIATLNYDNSIELRSKSLGISCSTGLSEWAKTGAFPTPEAGIDLIKLHGSVKWWGETINANWSKGLYYRELNEVDDSFLNDLMDKGYRHVEEIGRQVGVVFGGRNKLTAEGPFLTYCSNSSVRSTHPSILW